MLYIWDCESLGFVLSIIWYSVLLVIFKMSCLIPRYSALGAECRLVTTLLFRRFTFCCVTIFYSNIYFNKKKAMTGKEATFSLWCSCFTYFSFWQRFIHNLLEKMPSGRIRFYKVRAAIGKQCFCTLLAWLKANLTRPCQFISLKNSSQASRYRQLLKPTSKLNQQNNWQQRNHLTTPHCGGLEPRLINAAHFWCCILCIF